MQLHMVGKAKKEIMQSLLMQNLFLMVYAVKEIIVVRKLVEVVHLNPSQ